MPNIESHCLALVVKFPDGQWAFCGSATRISEGLALTNQHILNQIHLKAEPKHLKMQAHRRTFALELSGDFDMKYHLLAVRCLDGFSTEGVWQVSATTSGGDATDFALLQLIPLDEQARKFSYSSPLVLDLFFPAPGRAVKCFGFAGGKASCLVESPIPKLSVLLPLAHTAGTVSEHYGPNNGKKYPFFVSDMQTEDGMSGGPVISPDGLLSGINSSRMSADEQISLHLWSALFLYLPKNFPRPNSVPTYLAPDLQDRLLSLVFSEKIFVSNRKLFDEQMRDLSYSSLTDELQSCREKNEVPSEEMISRVLDILSNE